jgi:hypothetical protein
VNSHAYATDGTRQGGGADFGPSISWHALLWNGSAQDYIDLNPGPGISSRVFAMAPGQQVGQAGLFGVNRAALWSGTAASYIDMHPPGNPGGSVLNGTTGSIQVGHSNIPGGGFPHAGVWAGTAASFIDLHQFLPPGFGTSSATSIADLPGGSVVIGGWAAPVSAPSDRRAFLWTNVPAPATLCPMLAMPCVPRRRRSA